MSHTFTERQVDVLRLIATGHSNRQIGDALGISDQTVKNHITFMMARSGVHSRYGLMVIALGEGVVSLDAVREALAIPAAAPAVADQRQHATRTCRQKDGDTAPDSRAPEERGYTDGYLDYARKDHYWRAFAERRYRNAPGWLNRYADGYERGQAQGRADD